MNTYANNAFAIDTNTNVAGLIALKKSAPDGGDSITVTGATLTIESDLTCASITGAYTITTGSLLVHPSDSGHYFTVAELRAMNSSFADASAYPDANLEAIRDGVEGDFEIEANCAFVTRTASKTLSGSGGNILFPPNTRLLSVTACTIDGTALTEAELAEIVVDGQMLYRAARWPKGSYNIAITYTHGHTECPQPVKEAALQVARDRLVPSGLPGNVTSQVVDGIDYRIQLTSERNPFGDPNVAVVLRRWGCARTWVG